MIPRVLEDGELIVKPGLYLMPAARYHADCSFSPSISSGIVRTVLDETLMHAERKHPRFHPQGDDEANRAMDTGSAVHKYVLGRGEEIELVDAGDYKTKAAKEARDAARLANKIPLLHTDALTAQAMANPLREALEAYLGMDVRDCWTEVVVAWEEKGCWRRAMFDALRPDLLKAADVKSTAVALNNASLCRQIYSSGYHIQESFYLRGLDALSPEDAGRRRLGFIFGETHHPYAVGQPQEISEGGKTLSRMLVDKALAQWDGALASGKFPSYSRDVVLAEPPSWLTYQMGNEEF